MNESLHACNLLYDIRARQLLARGERIPARDTIEEIQRVAQFAWRHAPGLLCDPRLESLAVLLSRKHGSQCPIKRRWAGRRRILHVVSEAYPVGGHSRVLRNWIQTDRESEHALAVTRQRSPFPSWLASDLEALGVRPYFVNPELSALDRGFVLHEYASNTDWSAVILHQHPDDLAPVVAFAESGPVPVAVFNHADHVFWLGSSVADVIIDFTEVRAQVSRSFRSARLSQLLPLVVESRISNGFDREKARSLLGAGKQDVVLLAMGSSYKFAPASGYDFFRTMRRVLTSFPYARLYVIGVDASQAGACGVEESANIILLGNVVEPQIYCMAADIFVESFPLGGGLATLDVCRHGAAPMWSYGCPPIIYGELAVGILEGSGVCQVEASEEGYMRRLGLLIEKAELRERLGRMAAQFIDASCVGDGWLSKLQSLYGQLECSSHHVDASGRVQWLPSKQAAGYHEFQCHSLRGMLAETVWGCPFDLSLRDLWTLNEVFIMDVVRTRSCAFGKELLKHNWRALRACLWPIAQSGRSTLQGARGPLAQSKGESAGELDLPQSASSAAFGKSE